MFDPTEVEEERRLAYVGITRAKDRLYLTKSSSRMLYGSTNSNRPSRFLNEIPEEYLENIGQLNSNSFSSFSKPAYTPNTKSSVSSYSKPAQSGATSFKAGDRVKHKTFGDGMVISAENIGSDVLMEIAFDKVGTKKLMAKFARLTKI